VNSTLRRAIRDTIARLGLADAALSLYGDISRVNPFVLVKNARYIQDETADGLPVPPPDLVFLVASSTDLHWFLESGALGAATITDALRRQGIELQNLEAILDFGCGCGRILRHWHSLAENRVWGTDLNPRLIEWCQQNLPFGHFSVNLLSPPLTYPDREFELIYAFSVFTHLTENLQIAWIADLRRILKTGGYLLISTHGDRYVHRLNAREFQHFQSGQLVVKNNTKAPGSNSCSAYHPFAYVRDSLAQGFEIAEFVPGGARGNPVQDLYVLRRR
jgi:SAM-dependent methyltransferase